MSERKPLPFWSVIASDGIFASGTQPNSKPKLVVPRSDMDRADTGRIMRANFGRIVAAAEKRKRKRGVHSPSRRREERE